MDDKELFGMFLRREETAVAEAERMYGGLCLKVAENILGDKQFAQECVNDALLRMWETIPPNEPLNMAGYALRLTRNIALNRYHELRAMKRGGGCVEVALSQLGDVASDKGLPEKELLNKELMELIDRFLMGLPDWKRRVFIKKYFYFMSDGELAEDEGRSVGSVRNVLMKLRRQLRNYLESEGYSI